MMSTMKLFVIILFYLIKNISSTITATAPCPDVKPMSNFSWNAYKGLWFEVARYPDDWEKQGDCGAVEYTDVDGITYFNVSNVVNKKRSFVTGTLESKDGILYHMSSAFSKYEGLPVIPGYVVATDYKSWAVVYECLYDNKKRQRHDFCWLLSRYHTPKADVTANIRKILKSVTYIDNSKLIWSHLTDDICLL